jgi:transmembrane sensor
LGGNPLFFVLLIETFSDEIESMEEQMNGGELEQFWSLIEKVLTARASQSEMRQFQEILLRDEQLVEVFTVVQRNWAKAAELEPFEKIDIKADWEKVYAEITSRKAATDSGKDIAGVASGRAGRDKPGKPRHFLLRQMRYAAAVAMLILASAIFYWLGTRTNDLSVVAYNQIEAPMGSRSQVTLPDGSTVWLNAGSSIKYPSNFNLANRDVTLDGEAFFDVQKQDIPFVVYAMDVAFRVLGTEFNLKAYDDDEMIEATLVSGSLKIVDANVEQARFRELVLEPNQKATFYRQQGDLAIHQEAEAAEEEEAVRKPIPTLAAVEPIERIVVMQKSSVDHEVSWKDGILIFEGKPLAELIRILERRYDVTFVFEDERLKEYKYSGTLQDQTLEQVLNAMKLTSPMEYSLDEKTVFIRINPKTKSDYFSHLY